MSGASSRRILLMLCGMAALASAGCADLDLPSWVPFQGPSSDTLPGVVAPRERIEQLKVLAKASADASPEQRGQISKKLAADIRSEKDPLIRLEIIRTLGRYPSPEADAVLKAAMSDPEAGVRVTACEAWGNRTGDEAVSLLAEALRSDVDADVRLAAARGLGETKNPAAVAVLGVALEDADPAMQYRAVMSLQKVTGKNFDNRVDRWQQYVKGERVEEPTPSLAEGVRRLF